MSGDRVTITEGVVFGHANGRDLHLDLFEPPASIPAPEGGRPGVLLVHGGGWRQGDRTQLRGYGVLLGRAGYVCAACEYRLVGESLWPAQLHDVKAALRWFRGQAGELGMDAERIAVEGNSAGAHLALMLAGTQDDPAWEGESGNPGISTRVAAAIGVYAPTLFAHEGRTHGAVPFFALHEGGDEAGAKAASPLSYVTPDYPPTLLIHGTSDTTVPPSASIVMYEALVAAKVPVELHMYAEQEHAFDAHPKYGRQTAAEMLLFLDKYLAAKVPSS